MLDWIKDELICAFELYMLFDLGRNLLPLKSMTKVRRLAGNGIIWIMFIAVNAMNNSNVNLIIVPVIYSLFSIINTSGSVFKKVCIAICYYMMAIIPEFIFAIIINVGPEVSYQMMIHNGLSEILILMMMKMVTFILVKCIGQIHKKRLYEETQDRIFLSLLVLPLATIVLLCGMFYADIHLTASARYILLIGTIFLLFSNAFTFYLFDNMLLNANRVKKMERIYIKSKMERKYLTEIEKVNMNHQRLLHDINKYIRTAVAFITSGDTKEAISIFEKLDIKMNETRHTVYCESKILNAVLSERKHMAEKEGISFRIEVEPGIDINFIDDIDLISIIGNVLDNAYEAAGKREQDGYIAIKMYTENQGHFLIVNVDNNFAAEPVRGKRGYLTIKKDKENHGIGIHTVEQIVNKYQGKLEIKTDNREFRVTIIFQI